MPELPEVETIRRSLEKSIIGKTIQDISVLEKKQFIGEKKKVTNQKIIKIGRGGKILFLELSNGYFLNFHLKMTGEILFARNKNKAVLSFEIPRTGTNKLPNKFTRIIISFNDNSALFFNDLRKFGWLKITPKPEIPKGVEILSKDFSLKFLTVLTDSTGKPIKLLLIDQEKLAGLGNIYINDSLWEARINPLRKSNTLKIEEVENLYRAIKKIINQALKYQGSSASDEMYVMPDGSKGNYQKFTKVYDRENQSCRRDGHLIKRIKQNNRSTYFCPNCQK